MATAFQSNAFQNNAFQIGAVVVPEVPDAVDSRTGSRIVGGTFSRGKWRDLREKERLRQEALDRAIRVKRKREQEQREQQAQERREQLKLAIRHADESVQRVGREALVANAAQVLPSLSQMSKTMGDASASLADLRRRMDEDEEDAILLLLS